MNSFIRLILTLLFFTTLVYSETENNGRCNQADEILVNSSDTGSLDPRNRDSSDYWKFTPASSGTVVITSTGFSSDMDAYLYNSDCTSLLISDTLYNSNISLEYHVTANETYKLLLYAYGSGSYTLNIQFTPDSPSFRIADFTQQEGDSGSTVFHIPITLDPVSTEEQIIRYSTTAGTATVLSDFMSSTGTLTYSPGDSVQYIDITVYGDTLYENNEVFYINLSHVSGNAAIEDSQATITIGNDDVPGYITIEDDFSINEGNYGEYTKVVTVSATDLNGNTFTVDYTTNDGTATAGSDYTANSGTLTFTEDSPTQTIEMIINGDSTQENDETFQILLSNPIGSIINNASTTITLVNDDGGSSHIGSRDFIIRNPSNTRNIKGNLKVVGNTVLCYKAAGSSECSERTNPNNDTTLSFIDQDSTNYTYNNSSSATITGIPSDADIVWAALYTQGYPDWDSATTVTRLNDTPVYLTSPAGTTYDVEPNIIDLYRWNGYAYATFSELPNLIGLKGSEVNGQWMAANIKAREGQDTYLGYFGAWTLVIIYKDSSESLKNISVFDGYTNVSTYNPNVSIPISGFLTPTKGDIASTVSLFVGEGDNAYTGDQLLVEGTSIAGTNAFNSSTSGFTASPSLTNNFGIDIQNHDIGTTGHNLIANNQTSATIQLTSSGDSYFPSMVAFTTDLYEPRVCYYINTITDDNNNTVFADRKFTGSIQNNTNYHFDIWFSNMKKSADDTDIETAKLVQIYMNTNDINYTISSTSIMNLGESSYDKKTDLTDSDIFEFDEDQNQSNYRIGIGSNGLQGGTIEPADSFNDDTKKAFVTFESKFNLSDSNTSSVDLLDFFNFKASFKTDILTITSDNAQEIEQCVDLNTSATIFQPPLGSFNVVNEFSSITTTDPTDASNVQNALLTQIAGKAFNVKVLNLDADDLTTLEPSVRSILMQVVDASSITSDESTCSAAPVVYEDDTALGVTFNSTSSVTKSVTIPTAAKNVTFRSRYLDWEGLWNLTGDTCANSSNMSSNLLGVPQCYNGATETSESNKLKDLFDAAGINVDACVVGANRACYSDMYPNSIDQIEPVDYAHDYGCIACLLDAAAEYVCARDNFAVRPETYTLDANETKLYGGKTYTLDINATLSGTDNNVSGYTQDIDNSLDKNSTEQLSLPATCTTLTSTETLLTNTISFVSGNAGTTYSYPNIGDVNITISDAEWTLADQQASSGKGYDDCIPNSASNIPDGNGKIGCLIQGENQLSFIPEKFINTLTIRNAESGTFTYISSDANMTAHTDISLRAVLTDDSTATNYTAGCFAQDVNTTLSLITNPIASEWLTNNSTAINRINFYGDGNTTSFESNTTGAATLSTAEGNFTSGIANIMINFNFTRNTNDTDEPFHIAKNDFNITQVIDTDTVTGNDFNRSVDTNTTFYFGRVHAPDQTFNASPGVANIYYEVYCKDCNRTSMNIAGNESIDSINWYQNTLHTLLPQGMVNTFDPDGVVLMGGNPTSTTTAINQGNETQNVSSAIIPYIDKIIMTPDTWLLYNQFDPTATTDDFTVEFLGQGTWAGEGSVSETNTTTGKYVHDEATTPVNRVQKRIDW